MIAKHPLLRDWRVRYVARPPDILVLFLEHRRWWGCLWERVGCRRLTVNPERREQYATHESVRKAEDGLWEMAFRRDEHAHALRVFTTGPL